MNSVIINFYKFIKLHDCAEQQRLISSLCLAEDIKGTVLLAPEGINATLSGNEQSVKRFIHHVIQDSRFADLDFKQSISDSNPFKRLKIYLKDEIVKMGIADLPINQVNAKYVEPEMWDDFISESDAIIDVRNIYEIRRGSFINSINPFTKTFAEFPIWSAKWSENQNNKEMKLGILCTGGIRCEKAAVYLTNLGFRDVYQLKGGILRYLEKTKNKDNNWQGECFIFDDRIAVDDNLQPSNAISCDVCCGNVEKSSMKLNSKGRILCMSCKEKKFANFFSSSS